MAEVRKSKHWKIDPNIKITEFNKDEINEKNLVNQLLLFRQSDLSFSLIVNLFGSFDGKTLCHQYDTIEIPTGAFTYMDDKGKEHKNTSPFITTIGIWIFNIFFLRDFNFSFLFNGYINKNIDADVFGDINDTLAYALLEDKISVEYYKK